MSGFGNALVDFLKDMFTYMMIAMFLENTICSRALGTSTALFAVRKKFNVFWLGLVMTLIIAVSSVITYFVNPFVTKWIYSYYAIPAIYVAVIGVVYIAALLLTRRFVKKRVKEILPIVHISAFNCATLGALMLATNITGATFGAFLGFGIGSGLGFMIATYFVRLAYQQLSSENVPKAFRGFPITLIYIGIVSLAIYGLIGHELPF